MKMLREIEDALVYWISENPTTTTVLVSLVMSALGTILTFFVIMPLINR